MNPITQLKSTWHTIPTEVQRFLKRALLIFIIWKLIYHLFLFSGRVIDKPLTDWSTKGAEKIMQVFYLGFLFALPASLKRVLLFSISGISVIYITNIIRLAALASMNIHRISAV